MVNLIILKLPIISAKSSSIHLLLFLDSFHHQSLSKSFSRIFLFRKVWQYSYRLASERKSEVFDFFNFVANGYGHGHGDEDGAGLINQHLISILPVKTQLTINIQCRLFPMLGKVIIFNLNFCSVNIFGGRSTKPISISSHVSMKLSSQFFALCT